MAPNNVNPDLDEISERPENLLCGDCRAKAPKWASVNLGVLFCIDCSGAHRGLGTHISVVRSTTLDTWQQKWVDAVSRLGNTAVNDFFEHDLPEGARPQATDRAAMARFIRAKYERRQWCPKGGLAPHELMAQGRLPGAKAAQPSRQAAPAPAMDLLCMDDVQTHAATPPPAPEAFDLLGGLLAPPPAQPQPQEQRPAPAAGLLSLQGGLASLYQPPQEQRQAPASGLLSMQGGQASLHRRPQEQPPQGRFAALAAPGPAGTWGSAPGGHAAFRLGGGQACGQAYLSSAVNVRPPPSKLDSFGAIDPFSAFGAIGA